MTGVQTCALPIYLEELQKCLKKVARYITKDKYREYLNMLDEKRIMELAEALMVEYYDPLYQKSIDKYVYDESIFYTSVDEGVEKVVRYLNEKGIFGKECEK